MVNVSRRHVHRSKVSLVQWGARFCLVELPGRAKEMPLERESILSFVIDSNFDLKFEMDKWFLLGVVCIIALYLIGSHLAREGMFRKSFEIDSAQFGLHGQKVTIRPNQTDRQIAYQIWVELRTRKIGLEINLEDDVITEVYDSWYSFFTVTRELIKDVPVSKFRRADTERIIKLSIEVLNEGLRPHLTKWQERYRRWYDQQLKRDENADVFPQDIKKSFPKYDELSEELLEVNNRLIKYREKMCEIITKI